MLDLAALVGRILLSSIFIWDGWGKLLSPETTQSYIAKSGLPVPSLAYGFSVFMELGVGLALLAGLLTRLSGLGLALWCLVLAAFFHSNLGDHTVEIQFFKNLSMAGGMLYVAGFGGGAFSLDAMMLRRRVAANA